MKLTESWNCKDGEIMSKFVYNALTDCDLTIRIDCKHRAWYHLIMSYEFSYTVEGTTEEVAKFTKSLTYLINRFNRM